MFERFTRDARELVKQAEVEAADLGSPTIEAEHILLALCRRAAADGPAAEALSSFGLDHDAMREALDAERDRSLMAVGIAAGDFGVGPSPLGHRPRFATSARSALERALRVSITRADRRIGDGHILLALLQAEAGTVPRALAEAGVDRDELRARTTAAIDEEKRRR